MEINSMIQNLLQIWPDFWITPNDIIDPTPYIVTEFYQRFVSSLLEFPIDDTQQSIIKNTPNWLHHLVNECVITKCVNIAIERLKITIEFGILDLLNPTRHSFQKSLLFTQVITYGHNDLETITAAKSKVVKDLDAIDDLKSLIDTINEERNSIIIKIETNSEMKENWTHKTKENLLKSVETLEDILPQLEKENKLAENILLAHDTERQLLEEELLKLTTLNQELEEQIVDDHVSILYKREQIETKYEETISNWDAYSQAIDKKTETIATISNVDEISTEFIDPFLLNKIQEKCNCFQELENEFNQLTKELKVLENTNEKPHNFKKEMISLKEKKQALILKADTRLKNFDKEIAKLELEFEEAVCALNRQKHLIESCDNKISQAINYNEEIQKTIEVQNNIYRQQYKRILEAKSKLDNPIIDLLHSMENCLPK